MASSRIYFGIPHAELSACLACGMLKQVQHDVRIKSCTRYKRAQVKIKLMPSSRIYFGIPHAELSACLACGMLKQVQHDVSIKPCTRYKRAQVKKKKRRASAIPLLRGVEGYVSPRQTHVISTEVRGEILYVRHIKRVRFFPTVEMTTED